MRCYSVSVSEVYIYGSKYRIRSEEDKEYIDQVASYITDKMKELEQKANVLTTSKLAIMVAFNVADEFMQLKRDMEKNIAIVKMLEEKLESIED